MAENQSETVLIYRVDEASVNKAESRVKDLRKGTDDFNKSLDKTDDIAANVSKELERIGRQSKIDAVVADAKALERKTKDTDAAVKQLTADLKKMGATGSEAAQAAGSFSGGTISKKGVLGEIGTQVRNAPAIPIPGLGITTEPISKALIAFDRFKDVLGTTTGGIIGLGAALGVLAVALAVGQKLAEDNTRFAQAQTDALTNRNNLEEASTQSLIEQAREYSNTLNNNTKDLAATQQALTEFENALGGGLRVAAEVGNVVGVAGTELGVMRDKITELSGETALAEANLATAIEVLRERGFSEEAIVRITQAATEAELALADARSKSVLADAQRAGELEAARQTTNEKSKEELQALIDAENVRIATLKAELAVLQASGDTSKEVASKMSSLQSQLELGAQKSEIFRNAMSGAQTQTQKTAAAQIASAKASKAVAQEVTRMTGGLDELSNSLSKVTERANKPLSFNFGKQRAAALERDKELQKAAQDYQKQLTDINRDLALTFNDIGLGLQDGLEDLRINTGRDIRDALSEGAFLSIRDIQRDAKDDRADLEREAARDRRDAQIKANQELLDLQAQFLNAQIGQLQGAINTIRGGRTNTTQGSFIGIAPRS